MLTVVTGDMFSHIENNMLIFHQVNCQNAFGSGFAGAFAKAFPEIKRSYHEFCRTSPSPLLGKLQYVTLDEQRRIYGANSFTQEYYGRDGRKYTDEEKLLHNMEVAARACASSGLVLAMPWGVGCGLAGGDWNVIFESIESIAAIATVKLYQL